MRKKLITNHWRAQILIVMLLMTWGPSVVADCSVFKQKLMQAEDNPSIELAEQLEQLWEQQPCEAKEPDDIDSYQKMAVLHYHLHDFALSEKWYETYLALVEKQKGRQHPKYTQGLDALGHLFMQSGALQQARETFQQAYQIRLKQLGPQDSELAHSLNNLAGVLYQLGESQQAQQMFKQAADIWRANHGEEHHHYATAVNNQAWNHLQSGDHKQALPLFQHSLEKRERIHGPAGHHDLANSLTGLAHAHQLAGRAEHAERYLRRALPLLHASHHRDMRWQVQHHYSQNLAEQGHAEAAVFFAKQALDNLHNHDSSVGRIEPDSHKSFLADKSTVYSQLVDLLMDQGRLGESQQVLEMLREEEFFDFLHRDKRSGFTHSVRHGYAPHEQEIAKRYRALNQQLEALNRHRGLIKTNARQLSRVKQNQALKEVEHQLSVTHKALNQFLDALKTDFPQFSELEKHDLKHLHQLQDELKQAGPGVVSLHYLIGKERLHIILTTPTEQFSRQVGVTRKQLLSEIKAFRRAAQNLTRTPVKPAQVLYQRLIQPIRDELDKRKVKTLMLISDGALRYVPFSALYDGQKYLVEDFSLVLHNQVVDGLGKHSSGKPWDFNGFGLTKKVGAFSPLPSVEDELMELGKLLAGDVHLNEAFDQSSLQQALAMKRPLMHIASHFVLQPGTERDSYLVLGNGEHLSLAELRSDYDFSGINMLTLSACNTAMGYRAKGVEIDGLAALARHKGAHSVLASLWYINDEGTGKLMQRYYRIRHQQVLNKADTLRLVQLDFLHGKNGLERFSHPFYWAPFVLMGDWL